MNFNFLKIILTFFFLIGCQQTHNLEGNYEICHNGEYAEVYFKRDSMRLASENEWVKLSEWRKISFESDTLYFETFSEWRNSSTALVKFVSNDKIEFHILETDEKFDLESFDENLNFKNPKEFWKGYRTRMDAKKCEKSK